MTPIKAELVGARPLHLAIARPFCCLKAPLGLSLFRCATQTQTWVFCCVRAYAADALSLYARTQRLTENSPYKGLWLVVKTTTNQPHSVKCRKAALASIRPNPQNGNQGEMAVIRPSICLLPFWEQAKSVGQFGQLKKPDELRAGIRKSVPVSLPGARVQRCGSPVATSKGCRHFEALTEPTGETAAL